MMKKQRSKKKGGGENCPCSGSVKNGRIGGVRQEVNKYEHHEWVLKELFLYCISVNILIGYLHHFESPMIGITGSGVSSGYTPGLVP